MELSIKEIQKVLSDNPNKKLIDYGKESASLLSAVVLGDEYTEHLKQSSYFEDGEIFKERKKAVSNIDLFGRILQRESMVFEARGGSIIYNTTSKQDDLNKRLSNIRLGLSLRSWIKEICNRVYEVDPMGVIFMEKSTDGKDIYPTYKTIGCVYDYLPKGRNLEYVCFSLTQEDVISFLPEAEVDSKNQYYRFVDDTYDYIIERSSQETMYNYTVLDRSKHKFTQTPAFIVSDIIDFKDIHKFKSKIWQIVELGLKYMEDRSIRDLSKKYHGFPKAVMPMVQCGKCKGTGHIEGEKCESCNGSGWTTIKKVSDRIDLPLTILEENIGFDIRKILAYATPDIKTWNKQDDSLNDMEVLMSDCYWGTDYRRFTSGAFMEESVEETATKTLINLQPVYSRLERTAEWAEKTEEKIINFIGKQIIGSNFEANVIYGRDYILESTNQLLSQYQLAKSKGAPMYELNDLFERYLMSKYQNNPKELMIAKKLMQIEPMMHNTLQEVQGMGVSDEVRLSKMYFSDWYNTLSKDIIFTTPVEKLKEQLSKYITNFKIKENEPIENESGVKED